MDCVNHSGVPATAYCQTCGKPLCQACVRTAPGGQIMCEPCFHTWQSFQQPFAPVAPGAPNPAAAAVLGLIPGVGAMYNGQFFKALVHVVIFAILISITEHYGVFGIFIGAWVLYQSFEAFHTAKARRDGQPVPDPLGLNELGSWLNMGGRQNNWGQPGAPGPMGSGPTYSGPTNPGQTNPGPANPGPYSPGAVGSNPLGTDPTGQTQNPGYQQVYTGQPPYQSPFSGPYAPPASGFVDPAAPPIPPVPPVPPMYWRRKEPIGAIVLVGLGLLILLNRLDIFNGRVFEFSWPLALIGLGVFLMIRRSGYGQGGPK
jgi:hypothetical protein